MSAEILCHGVKQYAGKTILKNGLQFTKLDRVDDDDKKWHEFENQVLIVRVTQGLRSRLLIHENLWRFLTYQGPRFYVGEEFHLELVPCWGEYKEDVFFSLALERVSSDDSDEVVTEFEANDLQFSTFLETILDDTWEFASLW